jgi:hypothetical protein
LLFRLSVVAANFTRYAGGKSDSLLEAGLALPVEDGSDYPVTIVGSR